MFFFFSSRRRHTRFDCDWSSDVCSSDLLPGNGDFSAPPGLFFRLAALTLAVGFGATRALIFLLAPRLEAVLPALPPLLWVALAVGAGACALWFVLLLLSFFGSVLLLPVGPLRRRAGLQRMRF